MSRQNRLLAAALATVGAVTLAACSGGSSDSVNGGSNTGDGSNGTLHLVAYSVVQPGYDAVLPAFEKTDTGKGVKVESSYGASGDQSRKVVSGAPADVVSFSIEPDVTRLVNAGLVDSNWNSDAEHGVPFGSVVTLVVRKGNPKNIHTWDDLLKDGVKVVTPNPLSSGSAQWNLLAPYAAKTDGGKNPQAGLTYLTSLIKDHIVGQPKSGRDASELFTQGTGDVLISYENEAIGLERQGKAVEHVTPDETFKIENPVAVLKNSAQGAKAAAFRDFLYSQDGQRLFAQAGFRPVDPGVAAQFAAQFPAPAKLWTIADLGGWSVVTNTLFNPSTGKIAVLYNGK